MEAASRNSHTLFKKLWKALMNQPQRKILALFILLVSDSILTVYLITVGWEEVNPLMNWVIVISNVSWMAITKILIGLFSILFLFKYHKQTIKYIDWTILIYAIFLFGGLALQFIIELIR